MKTKPDFYFIVSRKALSAFKQLPEFQLVCEESSGTFFAGNLHSKEYSAPIKVWVSPFSYGLERYPIHESSDESSYEVYAPYMSIVPKKLLEDVPERFKTIEVPIELTNPAYNYWKNTTCKPVIKGWCGQKGQACEYANEYGNCTITGCNKMDIWV